MDRSDLDAIRAKRMAELQGSGPSGGSTGGDESAAAQQQQQQQQQQAAEEQRRSIMAQILSPEARERLDRIALVRPERARSIQDLLVRMAQSGQIRGRVSEDQLLGVLDQIEAGEAKQRGGKAGDGGAGKIVFSRRKGTFEDSDDDF